MSYTNEQVLTALRNVNHPEKSKNIVELNMVDDLRIEGKNIYFSLLFEKSNDPLIDTISKACVGVIQLYLDKEALVKGNISIKASEIINNEKPLSRVKNIVAVASGKGGVGKSTIASNLAVSLAKSGLKVGLVDADIFGPSIPKMFNMEGVQPEIIESNGVELITPVEQYGVKLLSIGFFVKPEDAMVWRGPMASNTLKQLILQTKWGELDILLIDLPPGTSDIHLTLVQEVSLTGAVIVSTPQDVALADAIKGISMFTGSKINVPILGLVENMAWFTPEELPNNKYYIFGNGGCKSLAEKMQLPLLGQIPIVQSIREGGDQGKPISLNEQSITGKAFNDLAKNIMIEVEKRNANFAPTQRVIVDPNYQGCSH